MNTQLTKPEEIFKRRDWGVWLDSVKIYPHPNADRLELVSCANRQFVTRKGTFREGYWALVIPDKSVLPEELAEPFKDSLASGNRVREVTLRGEVSEGIILSNPEDYLFWDDGEPVLYEEQWVALYYMQCWNPVGFAKELGITEYCPNTEDCEGTYHKAPHYIASQYSQFSSNLRELESTNHLLVTEKLHGSQINVYLEFKGKELVETLVTSKGLGKKRIFLDYNPNNIYWKAWLNSNIEDAIRQYVTETVTDKSEFTCVQLTGEVIPCKKGYSYAVKEPIIYLFSMLINGTPIPCRRIPLILREQFVPVLDVILWQKSSLDYIKNLATGHSSLDENTIREGIVVSDLDNPGVFLKYKNPDFKEG